MQRLIEFKKTLICIKMNATHVSMILFISVIHVCHWRPPFCFSFNFLELKVFNLKKIKTILPQFINDWQRRISFNPLCKVCAYTALHPKSLKYFHLFGDNKSVQLSTSTSIKSRMKTKTAGVSNANYVEKQDVSRQIST